MRVNLHFRFLRQHVLINHHEILSRVHNYVINDLSQNDLLNASPLFILLLFNNALGIVFVLCGVVDLIVDSQH